MDRGVSVRDVCLSGVCRPVKTSRGLYGVLSVQSKLAEVYIYGVRSVQSQVTTMLIDIKAAIFRWSHDHHISLKFLFFCLVLLKLKKS